MEENNHIEKNKDTYFSEILTYIHNAKNNAIIQVNREVIDLYWIIGKYVQEKIDENGWGKSTVQELSDYILSKEPGIKGYSAQNIWRMRQFYEIYKDKPKLSTLLRVLYRR